MQTLTLRIGGMTCGGCTATVVKVLRAVQGVQQAEADLAAATATIAYDETQTRPAALIAAVENAGFDAEAA